MYRGKRRGTGESGTEQEAIGISPEEGLLRCEGRCKVAGMGKVTFGINRTSRFRLIGLSAIIVTIHMRNRGILQSHFPWAKEWIISEEISNIQTESLKRDQSRGNTYLL